MLQMRAGRRLPSQACSSTVASIVRCKLMSSQHGHAAHASGKRVQSAYALAVARSRAAGLFCATGGVEILSVVVNRAEDSAQAVQSMPSYLGLS